MDPIEGQPSSDLLLRVTPPKVSPSLIARKSLDPLSKGLDVGCVLVSAPAGFGKTSLLSSWRRTLLSGGYIVGWVAVQADEGVQRFIAALTLSVRLAAARPSFGRTLNLDQQNSSLETITAWLAELAQSAIPLAMVIDDIDRLSPEALQILSYIIRNAPANLRLIFGCRSEACLDLKEPLAYGQAAVVGQSALRFKLPDVIEFLNSRYHGAADADLAARVFELTEGWPLGLQLLVAAAAQSDANPVEALSRLTKNSSAIQSDWMGLMLSNLKVEDVHFLESISLLQDFNASLCSAVAQDPQAEERLARLQRETPLVIAAEQGNWMRLHTLARKNLQQRLKTSREADLPSLHLRACQWFIGQGLPDLAAFHALEAGDSDQAYQLAERSLYTSLMVKGQQAWVMYWLERMPKDQLVSRPRMTMAVAWSLAVSDRHEEAKAWIEPMLSQVGLPVSLQCEAALILAGAAVFADDPDAFAALHDPWADKPPISDTLLLHVHANRSCYRALLSGNPGLARIKQQAVPPTELGGSSYLSSWGELGLGLTYLWEGQVQLVESLLNPALARTEIDLGRRHVLPCMLAAFLATAMWERGSSADAAALLANRMDVLERRGMPESVLLAYRTLARMAAYNKQEHRAMELLDGLFAMGQNRSLPRLCVTSLVEQIRLHARAYRAQTCEVLYEQLEAFLDKQDLTKRPMWAEGIEALRRVGLAYANVAAKKWRLAAAEFQSVGASAARSKLGRLRIEALGMQAFALDQCGEKSKDVMREAMDLASVFGLHRVFQDAHPDLGLWVDSLEPDLPATASNPMRPNPASKPAPSTTQVLSPFVQAQTAKAMNNHALTPKEREVLVLLARNLSNKEIGNALEVGEETIKWHVKNLFAKLDAGSRKQVVARAQLFGLLG